MPVITHTEDWIKPFRRQVRAKCGDDWKVLNNRGRFRLQVQGVGSVALPYPWNEEGCVDALQRILEIRKRYGDGSSVTLAQAATVSNTASDRQTIDWSQLFRDFRAINPQASDATWKKNYAPILKNIRQQFQNGEPKDAEQLYLQSLKQWKQGSRQRQIMRQKFVAFIEWAVQRGHLKPLYLPPNINETLNPKRIGYPLKDSEILRLLDGLPAGEKHDRWRFAIQLMAVYGCRPEDLRYLRVKDGVNGPELWSIYEKSQGGKKGKKTAPRRLQPLLVHDIDGSPIEWNLLQRLQVGEQLPSLGPDGRAGSACKTYFEFKPIWIQLKAEAEHQGEHLTSYSFRHRFAKQSHAAGIPIANICETMGHKIDVHLKSYAQFKPSGTADLYAAVNVPAREAVKQ